MTPSDHTPTTLAIAAIFKNETPYLREWIEFHRMVGVDHFFLYDNGSDASDWHEILDPYIEEGIVQITHWPGNAAQLSSYRHALTIWGPTVRWLAFLDIDEFLFSPDERLVTDVLGDYSRAANLGVCWAVYGTSGVRERPEGLVTETYQHRSSEFGLSRHVKSIVRTAHALDAQPADPHHFAVAGPSVDTLWRPLEGPFAVAPTYKHLRINHYVSKSEQEATAKMFVPRADNGQLREMNLLDASLNEVYDPAILPWLPKLKQWMAGDV